MGKTKKMKITTVITTAAIACLSSAFASISSSTGPIVPGEWNRNFAQGKQYAEAYNIPMVVFWANNGCSHCEKIESSMESDVFHNWMMEKGFVFIFEMGSTSGYPEEGDAHSFIKSCKDGTLGGYPDVVVYWPKPDGSAVYTKFSAWASMPVRDGSSYEENVRLSIESLVYGAASGKAPTRESTSSVSWNKAASVFGRLWKEGEDLGGVVELKFGKTKKNKSTAKVSAVLTMNGATYKNSVNVDTSAATFSIPLGGGELVVARTGAQEFVGIYGDYSVESVVFGGADILSGNMNFMLFGAPATIDGEPVIADYLPKTVSFTGNGKKWSFAGGSLKYRKADGSFQAEGDPSKLKLSYKSKTGEFSGSFAAYYVKKGSLKKLSVKVSGYVFNGRGYGWTDNKKFGSYDVMIMR